MLPKVIRVIGAPVFLAAVFLGTILTVVAVACISVSSWSEAALQQVGYKEKPRLLPVIVGVVAYVGVGIIALAFLGNSLLGWPGAIFGPLLGVAAIAVIERW